MALTFSSQEILNKVFDPANNRLVTSGAAAIGGAVTSGTSGSILFVDSSGQLAQDNTNLFWNATTSDASIGGVYFNDELNSRAILGSLRFTGASGQRVSHSTAISLTVSGAANNGSGLIRITTAAAHGLSTGASVTIASVGGTTEANSNWVVTVITSTTFDLVGSTFTNAYTSGGTVVPIVGTAAFSMSARILVPSSNPANIGGICGLTTNTTLLNAANAIEMHISTAGTLQATLYGATTGDSRVYTVTNNLITNWSGQVAHIALTRSGSTVVIYVNGVAQAKTEATNGSAPADWSGHIIGQSFVLGEYTNTQTLNTRMYNARFYAGVALTAAEVDAEMSHGVNNSYRWGVLASATAGCILDSDLQHADPSVTTTVLDISSNNFSGTTASSPVQLEPIIQVNANNIFTKGLQPVAIDSTPGTAAAAASLTSGTGGNTTITTTGVGGAGGAITVTSGTGGVAASAAVSSTGGAGGAYNVFANNGGTATVAGTGTNTGGQGGTLNVFAGSGGAATGATSGTNTGGAGGNITLISGTGGAANTGSGSLVGATGGTVNVQGGTGGIGSTSGGAGGSTTVQGGNAAAMAGASSGALFLQTRIGSTTGTGGAAGSLSIVPGNAGGDDTVSRAGGQITLTAGNSKGSSVGGAIVGTAGTGGVGTGTTGAAGGQVTWTGGTGGAGSAVGGAGGAVSLIGGTPAAVAGAAGGAVNLTGTAGTSTGTGGAGGAATITGGAAGGDNTTNRAGGAVSITSGSSKGDTVGAAVTLTSGTGGAGTGATGAIGGAVTLQAGPGGANATTSAAGGAVNIRGGLGGSTGTPGAGGAIIFQTAATTTLTTRLTINAAATITVAEANDIVFGTTTGTKLGTATSQKISLWNATPIVQPTTGIAASTFVANTSGTVNDSATWDSYTIGQVVKALRNIGILA